MRATVLLAALAALEGVIIVSLLLGDGPNPSPPAGPPAQEVPAPGSPPPEVSDDGDARPETTATADADTRACLYGRLSGSDGKPPSGRAWVTVLPRGGRALSAQVQSGGDYAHAGLKPGTYGVKVSVEGYDQIDEELVVPEGVETIRRDFALTKSIEVAIRFLTPDGKPLLAELNKPDPTGAVWFRVALSAVATVDAPGPRLPATLRSAWTEFERGKFRSPQFGSGGNADGRDGTLAIRGALPVHVSACLRSEVLATVRLDEPKEVIEFRIDPERIRDIGGGVTFRLTADGKEDPASRVLVNLSDQQTGGMGAKPERDGESLVARSRVPGLLLLTIWGGTTFEHYERIVDVPPSTILDLGTIHLTPCVEFTGTVVGADGNPVAGARITKYAVDRSWAEQSWSPMGSQSGSEGKFTLSLGRRRYVLRAHTRDQGMAVGDLDLTGGVPESFRMVLSPCHPVTVKPGQAAFPLLARIEDDAGRVLTSRRFTTAWPWNLRLPEGSYTLVITREGRASSRRSFEVAAGKDVKGLSLDW